MPYTFKIAERWFDAELTGMPEEQRNLMRSYLGRTYKDPFMARIAINEANALIMDGVMQALQLRISQMHLNAPERVAGTKAEMLAVDIAETLPYVIKGCLELEAVEEQPSI